MSTSLQPLCQHVFFVDRLLLCLTKMPSKYQADGGSTEVTAELMIEYKILIILFI